MARLPISTPSLILIGLCVVVLALPVALIALRPHPVLLPPAAPGLAPTVLPDIRPFRLTDQHGRPFGTADLKGSVALVYFGYTFCPDICPTELGYVARVMRGMKDDAARVVPVFITVDPERDSQQVMADYAPLFDKRLVALRGTAAETDAVAAAYGVFHQKTIVESKQAGYYLIDHSSTIFVLDAQGRIADTLDADQPVAASVSRVRRLLP